MTKLEKPINRVCETRTLRYDLIVRLEPGGILKLKEKFSRGWYSIGLEALYKRLVVEYVRNEREKKRRKR